MLRRALVALVAVAVAVVIQVTMVNRLPLPGGAAPDLVLLVVTALAVTGGPARGMLAGFLGGLALDVVPPAGGLAGEYALVFCLAGYVCARLGAQVERASPPAVLATAALPVMAAVAVAAEAVWAGLHMMLSDPQTTASAVEHLLPVAVVYDLVLCPFVLWFLAAAQGRPAKASAAFSPPAPLLATRVPWPAGGSVVRLAGAAPAGTLSARGSAVPRLRFSGSRPAQARPAARPAPRLRLASGSSSLLSRTYPAAPSPRPGGGRPARLRFGSRGGGFSGALGPSLFAGARPVRAGHGRARPGKNWLRGGAPRPVVRKMASPGKNWLRGGAPRPVVRKMASPGKNWLRGGAPRPVARKMASPGKNWLRVPRPRAAVRPSASPGKGWLRPAKPPPAARRKSPGHGWLSSKPPRIMWQRKSPRHGWLNRRRGLGGRGLGTGGHAGRLPGYRAGRTRIGGRR